MCSDGCADHGRAEASRRISGEQGPAGWRDLGAGAIALPRACEMSEGAQKGGAFLGRGTHAGPGCTGIAYFVQA